MKKKFYAYYIPSTKESNIVDSWPDCQKKVSGIKSSYKSFQTLAEAKTWLNLVINPSESIDVKSSSIPKASKFYACYLIKTSDYKIFTSWEECKQMVERHNCRYKSFKTYDEALEWLEMGGTYVTKKSIQGNLPEGIYFDAGTGRGTGVETRVTFKNGESILPKYFPNENINEFGNLYLGHSKTNNYGELMGIYMALDIALKENIKNIFGDSALVINYWSKGLIKNTVNLETRELARMVKSKREVFESLGGSIEHVSGDYNPADLGFHK